MEIVSNVLPRGVMGIVMRYHSHPVADLFKAAMKPQIDELNEVHKGDYLFGMGDYCIGEEYSFANHFFHPEGPILSQHTRRTYYYAWMGRQYVETLNETLNQGIQVYVF